MSCACGCGGGIGALTAAELSAGDYAQALVPSSATTVAFQASAIMGDAVDDVNTASQVVDTFTASGVDYTGDNGKKQVEDVALALNLIPGVGTILGGAILAITSAVGIAHAGPGACTTDPPDGPGWGDLKSWPHYVDWEHSGANLSPPGQAWAPARDFANSFEAYANQALAYNEALADNCYSALAVQPYGLPALLAQLIASWNASHLGPTRTIARTMPCGNIGCTAKSWDPIADALYWTDPSGALSGKTLTFTINGGPHRQKILKGVLTVRPAAAPAPNYGAPAATPSSSSRTALVVAGGAAVAAAAYYVHTRGLPTALAKLVRF